ncbi:hypothetical protein [Streptomyces sp. ERV7]|uniref:hypothetical protein n=1 Tax=Streptomyces sp. ERV7 TaxID=1322334 RepID=UPI001F2C4A77|nr:hypothetical protein [Streptomyces sp. ERV7]
MTVLAALTACEPDGAGQTKSDQSVRQSVRQTQKASKMNMQQAGEGSETILDGTLAAIRPPVKWAYGAPMRQACTTDLNEPTGRTTVTRSRNILTIVSPQRRGSLLGVVQRHWEREGFKVTSVRDGSMPWVRASRPDGFSVSLQVGSVGNVFISASFGCAEDAPMTYPKGTPGQPGGPRGEELRPSERSEFWSATEG